MSNAALSQTIRRVASLENTDDSASAPGPCALDNLSRQRRNVMRLEREAAKRVAGERVESCGDENDVRYEASCGRIDSSPQGVHVLLSGQSGSHRKIPHILAQASITCGSGARIPRPLVHRHEMNCGIVFDERLRSVPVMNIPVNDQHSLQSVNRLRVTGGERDVADQTESHRPGFERMMTWRTNRAERSRARMSRAIDCCECATGSRSCCVPGAFACDSVGVELAAAGGSDLSNDLHILSTVHEGNLFHRGVPPFELLN